MQDIWWRDHWNTLDRNTDDWRDHPDNGDPYDTDELDQFYQDEIYLNNLFFYLLNNNLLNSS